MVDSLIVEELSQEPMDKRPFEVVERKGVGHPDTIADTVMDSISVRLGKEYLNRTGSILHFNLDKSLLVAGETCPSFKGGTVKRPILFIFGDRATFAVDNNEFDVAGIAKRTTAEWIGKNLRFVDPERHVRYQVEIGKSSTNLADIFRRRSEFLGANDTSAAVGYAPESNLERTVRDLEGYINSPKFKASFPETGEDVKIMGVRRNNDIHLTLAIAFVDRFIESEGEYFRRKDEVRDALIDYERNRSGPESINLFVNTLDRPGRGIDGIYLTTLGTSVESGDSGQVGRGNRVNGVIALNRPAGSEAAAGKNPTSHVGKIYNILSFKLARKIVEEVESVSEAYVWLVSQIGRPINEPTMVAAHVIPKSHSSFSQISGKVKEIMTEGLDRSYLQTLINDLTEGRIKLC